MNEKPLKSTVLTNSGINSDIVNSTLLGSDDVLETRIIQEFKSFSETKNKKKPTKKIETDFSQLSENDVFSKTTYYKLFNRDNQKEFIINGKTLEAKIGLDNSLYNKLKARSVRAFSLENSILLFLHAELNS